MTKHGSMHAATLFLALVALAGAFSPAQIARIDRVARYVMHDRAVAGCAVGVIRGDGARFERAYGYANPARRVATRVDTVFAVGSIAKPLLAASVLQLADRGGVRLDASAAAYLPRSDIDPRITVRMLIDQTAGLADFTQDARFDRFSRAAVSPQALLAGVLRRPLDFTPGTQWQYSNTNYLALALVLEGATHEPLARFLHDSTFAPLGMSATRTWMPAFFEADRATGNAPWGASSLMFGYADLQSTVPDLERFIGSLYAGTRASFLPAMLAPASTDDGAAPYGMGFFLARLYGRDAAFVTGYVNGFSSAIMLVPSSRLGAIVLCNADRVDLLPLAHSLVAAALNAPEARVPAAR